MISFQNLSFSYRDSAGLRRDVLRGVSAELAPAQFVCLLGPSGCGKTTLLNLLAGFLRPDAGIVCVNGTPVAAPGPDRGVVFQEPMLFPWLTVRRNVEFGLRQARGSAAELNRRVSEVLAQVGMADRPDAYPHALSGGMRQRVALARVVALRPRVLLLDEPFSALDALARERLQDVLLDVWAQSRTTVFFVTHSVEEAAYLADRVLIMGPPPARLVNDITVDTPRPRDRLSDDTRATARRLRAELDRLPCCAGETVQREETHR